MPVFAEWECVTKEHPSDISLSHYRCWTWLRLSSDEERYQRETILYICDKLKFLLIVSFH